VSVTIGGGNVANFGAGGLGITNINASGKVGIGTGAPRSGLHVVDDGMGTVADNGLTIEDTSTGADGFATIRMDSRASLSSKSLGIHYGGNFALDNELRFGRYADNFGVFEATPVVFDMDAPSNSFTVGGNGNVGIGTVTPTLKLEVVNNTNATDVGMFHMRTNTSYVVMSPNFTAGSYNNLTAEGDAGIMFGRLGAIDTVSTGFVLAPWSGAYFKGMRMDGNGNVGIGTSNPLATLHVSGTVAADGVSVTGVVSSTRLFLAGMTGGSGVSLAAGGAGGGTPGGVNGQVQFNNNGAFGGHVGLVYNNATSTLTGVNMVADTLQVTNSSATPCTAVGDTGKHRLNMGDVQVCIDY
jgi:hypothetical protein